MKATAVVSAVSAVLVLGGCYTVPETGRRAFILPIYDDAQMGAEGFASVKAQGTISDDSEANARVPRVGERIAAAVGSDLPSAQGEFVVFDDSKEINAFAPPGAKSVSIPVCSGSLKPTTNWPW